LEKPFGAKAFEAAVKFAFYRHDPELLRVLTVDDDTAITNFVGLILSPEGIHVRALHEPIKILEVLEEFQPDAVLLDVTMPGVSGYDVCRMLREHEQWSDLPILFLTSRSDAEGRGLAFQAGASDFLAKPILSQELLVRVRSQIDQSQRVRRRLDRDPVTRLIQRVALEKQLEATVGAAQQSKEPMVLCLLEIDALDEVHGKFGVAGTKQAFALVGSTLLARFRSEDIKAQLGNLFIVAFPGKTAAEVEPAVQLLSEELRHHKLTTVDRYNFNISVSFGLAELFVDTGKGIELLGIALDKLRIAQKALTSKIRS
jgi:diguanylate cyclase (GGDEF)-like protein